MRVQLTHIHKSFLFLLDRMLDNYDRGEVTPPPVSSYGSSPGLLALHSSLYATPTSRAYDIDPGIDGNDSSMSIDTQIISVSRFVRHKITENYVYVFTNIDSWNVEQSGAATIRRHVMVSRVRLVPGLPTRFIIDSYGGEDVPSWWYCSTHPQGTTNTSAYERVHGLGEGRT